MEQVLTHIILEQTNTLFHNVSTMLKTCDMAVLFSNMPIWKHVYHMLHSCDRWFINPNHYEEPPFHEPDLNSLEYPNEKVLSRGELILYFESIKVKIFDYLENLTDDQLSDYPSNCSYTRMALILGQFRHLYAHLGNINATTVIATGEWPRVVGLDGDLSDSLFE